MLRTVDSFHALFSQCLRIHRIHYLDVWVVFAVHIRRAKAYCPKAFRQWSSRWPRLAGELAAYAPDILVLQVSLFEYEGQGMAV